MRAGVDDRQLLGDEAFAGSRSAARAARHRAIVGQRARAHGQRRATRARAARDRAQDRDTASRCEASHG
jgi:hypothetical protein